MIVKNRTCPSYKGLLVSLPSCLGNLKSDFTRQHWLDKKAMLSCIGTIPQRFGGGPAALAGEIGVLTLVGVHSTYFLCQCAPSRLRQYWLDGAVFGFSPILVIPQRGGAFFDAFFSTEFIFRSTRTSIFSQKVKASTKTSSPQNLHNQTGCNFAGRVHFHPLSRTASWSSLSKKRLDSSSRRLKSLAGHSLN